MASLISLAPLVILSTFLVPPTTPLVRRYHYEAQLTGKEGGVIHFSRTKPEAWKNITALAHESKIDPLKICTYGRGSWLAYPEPGYNILEYPYYYYIMGEECISTDFIKSVQPLGEMFDPINQGLVYFPNQHFMGKGTLLKDGSSPKGTIGSIVFMGGEEFTIGSGSDAVCLIPVYWAQHQAPCLIPTLDSSFGFKSPVSQITKGCSAEAKLRTFSPQNCVTYGLYEFFADKDFSFKKMSSFCSAKDGEVKAKFGQVMEIWKGRINHNLENLNSIKLPYGSEFKIRIVDQMIKLFHFTCPLIQPEYLSILKNIYLIHLREAWTKNPELIGVEDDYWKHTSMFMESCLTHLPEVTVDVTDCEVGGLPDSPDQEPFEDIVEIHDYDMVIEQMWLIFNQVTPFCNQLNSYKTNDWVNMVSLFRRSFFDPLSQQWMYPGAWRSIYTTMFHGFNMGMERGLMVSCLRKALSKTPTYDPIGRTRFFLRVEEAVKEQIEANIPEDGKDKKDNSLDVELGETSDNEAAGDYEQDNAEPDAADDEDDNEEQIEEGEDEQQDDAEDAEEPEEADEDDEPAKKKKKKKRSSGKGKKSGKGK